MDLLCHVQRWRVLWDRQTLHHAFRRSIFLLAYRSRNLGDFLRHRTSCPWRYQSDVLALLRVEASARAFCVAHLFGHLRLVPRSCRRAPRHPRPALRRLGNGHRIESYGRAVGHGVRTL